MKLAVTQKAAELIADAEGFDQPSLWPGGGSGVTIGVGYDLGFYAEHTFRANWAAILPTDAIDRLAHSIGVTGLHAKSYCATFRDIRVPHDGALLVFRDITLPDYAQRAGNTFPGAENLPPDAQGALVSLVFNRGTSLVGDRREEMALIASALRNWKNGDAGKDEVLRFLASQIRAMKRLWRGQGLDGLLTRRENEARLIESTIT